MDNTVKERKSIFRIRTVVRGTPDWGTGFVVGEGLALTAFHVIGDRKAEGTVLWDDMGMVLGREDPERKIPFELVDGAFDKAADWALLRFTPPEGLELAPLPLSTVGPQDRQWYSFGFAKTQFLDGMKLDGSIDDAQAAIFGNPALQVFCKQMAAGEGAEAGGASGSPVLVDGRVVGLLRFSLADDAGRNRAGTLYACPSASMQGRTPLEVLDAGAGFVAGLSPGQLEAAGRACGRVFLPGGAATGYLVGPESMVTCSGRLTEEDRDSTIRVQLGDAELEGRIVVVDAAASTAIIRLSAPLHEVPPLRLEPCGEPRAPWVAVGYPDEYPDDATGEVVAPRRGGAGQPPLLELHSERFAPGYELGGMEGAPVLVSGAVAGHLFRLRGPGRAFAALSEGVQAALASLGSPDHGVPQGSVGPEAGAGLAVPELPPGEFHVAVCFRGEDQKVAQGLANRLEGLGFKVLRSDFQPGDSPENVRERLSALDHARGAVVVLGSAWAGFSGRAQVETYLFDRQREDESFRVVSAIFERVPGLEAWSDRPGVLFTGGDDQDAGGASALLRLAHRLLGTARPAPGSTADLTLRNRAGAADQVAEAVGAAAREASRADGPEGSPEVLAAEAAGVAQVARLWDEWRASGVQDAAAALAVAHSFVRLGRPRRALEALDEGGAHGTRAQQLRAMALTELDQLGEAIEILETLRAEGCTDVETTSMLGGRWKRRWLKSRQDGHLSRARELYDEAWERTGDHYPGMNAAALALWQGDRERAQAVARRVVETLSPTPAEELDDWSLASLAEARLILGDDEEARTLYRLSVSNRPNALRELVSMRRQLRLDLEALGRPADAFDDLFHIPRVAVYSGHLTDAPDRAEPRFPESAVSEVRRGIEAAVRENQVGIAYGSAARGADLLFIAALVEAGAEVDVYLPFPLEAFKETSVGPDFVWREEFDTLLAKEGVFVTVLLDEDPGTDEGRDEAYAACNAAVMERARDRAAALDQEPLLLHVWDGRPPVGAAGTAALVRRWEHQGLPAPVAVGLPETG